jgi:peptide-methionine (R)-S-oxide reductase
MSTNQKAYPVQKTEEEWRKILTPEQYYVMREHGTERPGSCALLHEKRAGTFTCAACGQPLFVAERKFESGTGWPSFFAPLAGAIDTTVLRIRARDDRETGEPENWRTGELNPREQRRSIPISMF